MLQEQLNHLMLLHVHRERTDALDMKKTLNDFIENSEHRSSIFCKKFSIFILITYHIHLIF